MKRGPPRRYDPTIPKHINQLKLPPGAYWDKRDKVWYTLYSDGERRRRRRLAGRDATLADLHALIEAQQQGARHTIEWLDAEFRKSTKYKGAKSDPGLSEATKADYAYCLAVLKKTPTRLGQPFSQLDADRVTKELLQVLVDKIAETRPSTANHVKRYMGRLYAWGMARGKVKVPNNPAHGIEAAKERAEFKMPAPEVMKAAIDFARERGARPARTKGSCPHYVWIVLTIAYRCRLRGVEVLTLTDANATEQGILTNRRKGSRDNMVRWSPELRDAWDTAVSERKRIWQARDAVIPLHADKRTLIVNQSGQAVVKSTFQSTWRRFTDMAVAEGIFRRDQYFTLHGLKHRGITDSKNKKDGGHATEAMTHRYDHEIPLVDQAGD